MYCEEYLTLIFQAIKGHFSPLATFPQCTNNEFLNKASWTCWQTGLREIQCSDVQQKCPVLNTWTRKWQSYKTGSIRCVKQDKFEQSICNSLLMQTEKKHSKYFAYSSITYRWVK